MVKASEFVAQCRIPLDEGWGYIWGTSGQTWTVNSKITSSAPANSKANAAKYGSKWIGKRVTDCSGLLYWAGKQLGISIAHGANSIYNSYCGAKGKISADTVMKPGMAVFLYDGSLAKPRHHVGVFVGNDTVIEAKGTQWGVVTSRVSHWDEWGELKAVDYTEEAGEKPGERSDLRKGDRGEKVRELQELLIKAGYPLPRYGADGSFGDETLAALKSYQAHVGLTADGVAGEQTMAALREGKAETMQDANGQDALRGILQMLREAEAELEAYLAL